MKTNQSAQFKEISPYEIENALKLIGKDWMLITAKDQDGANAMTASWGAMGILWNKPVAICFIRPQRYTFDLVENQERLSLAFFDDAYKGALNICGTRSGRDCDKLALAELTTSEYGNVPIINEARLVLVCRKLYVDRLDEKGFCDSSLLNNYKDKDYHAVYVMEIEKALIK